LVTLEEGSKMGGAGSAVLESLQSLCIHRPVLCLGFDDAFTQHGDPSALMKDHGLTAPGIQAAIEARWPELASDRQDTVVPFKKVG
jgi:1-deoxy-D-xylulose-5-phosphate synthase